MNDDALRQQFPQQDLIYLNHAAVAPWPRATRDAVCAFADENLRRGAANYPAWVRVERQLRDRLRQLIGAAHADDIALLKNTSEAVSVVAWGFPWRAGDNLVLCRQEFPSNRIAWESLHRIGVQCRYLDLAAEADPEGAMIDAIDSRTRLLATSSVQYADGFRMHLPRLGAACRARGVALFVDAIQSLGALPFDVAESGADFVVADGHKWMLGPEGVALFYCAPEWRERLTLYQYGWHMTREFTDFDAPDWHASDTAKRFECGSMNMLGIHGLHASLGLLLELGVERVWRRLAERTALLIERIGAAPQLELLTDSRPQRRSGIVTFRRRDLDGADLLRRLRERRIVCAPRLGGVRFSPHFYTDSASLEAAVAAALEV